MPNLQPHAKRVDNYVRGQTWIAAPFASKELFKRQPDGRNYVFTEEEKKEFSADPVAYQKFRYGMEQELNAVHAATMVGSDMQNGAVEAFKQDSESRACVTGTAILADERSRLQCRRGCQKSQRSPTS